MADRKDFYFRQKVTEAELDDALDGLEEADRNMLSDLGILGASKGLAVTEESPTPNITVDVETGVAYDQTGQRMNVPSEQNVDVSEDFLMASTDVAGGGNEKIVSVFLEFQRVLSDPRIDGNSNTVFFLRDESFAFKVRQGAEAAPPATPPPLQANEILLADITRTNGQTQIFDVDIDLVTRRQTLQIGPLSPEVLKLISDLKLSGAITLGGMATLTALSGAAAVFDAGSSLAIAPVDEYKYSSARVVTRVVNLFRAQTEDVTGSAPAWFSNLTGAFAWSSQAIFQRLMVPLDVPDGVVNINMRVLVKPGVGCSGGDRMVARIRRATHNFDTPAATTPATISDQPEDDGTANFQILTVTGTSPNIVKGDMVWAEVISGLTGDVAADLIVGVEITYTVLNLKPEHGG